MPASQMRRSVEVEADHLRELLGRLGSAGAKHVEIRLDHRVALELVLAEDREREEEAVRIRVDVAGRPDEVRDVAPPGRVAVDVDRVSEQLGLAVEPQLLELLGRELALVSARRCARCLRSGSSAICRKTVAIESSIRPASRLSLRCGSSSIASSRLNVSASPKTDAVSAVVSGVEALKSPSGCAR